ncbi:MAG: patatin-like phospholipase family protein [Polyangiales bacterium]|jgi:NTE family protein
MSGERTALVLSGGGARGAYEAGVVSGIVDVLGQGRREQAPFSIFTGTSVGAINATWLAAHADRTDMNVQGLAEHWQSLTLTEHLRFTPGRFLRATAGNQELGRSLVDYRALERLVRDQIPYSRLHDNVQKGVVDALVVAALNISTARTTMFAEVAPGRDFIPSRDPRRVRRLTQIGWNHVLASAAIPLVFPARRIGSGFYCDGSIRFNTPLAPAIRAGAERLVVVSALHREEDRPPDSVPPAPRAVAYPSPMFLMGKVLNALLLDPVNYDLNVLQRFNRVWEVLEETSTSEDLARVVQVLRDTRGLEYKRLQTLVFHPSEDIGEITTRYARTLPMRSLSGALVALSARIRDQFEADLLSFILFDAGFARELLALGRRDAHRRADEIISFFA